MKAEFIKQAPKSPVGSGTFEPGDTVESREAWHLVELGLAKPADEECEAKIAERKKELAAKAAIRSERLKVEAAKVAAEAKAAEVERHEEFEQILKSPE